MADLQHRGAITDLEGTLSRLRGVLSARVVRDERGDILEVHVLAEPTRHAKQISRDIESALFSEFGIRIDHRKISIAQTRDSEALLPADMRVRFLHIDYTIDRTSARARVSIGKGDETYIGVASTGAGGNVHQEQLVARATLEAVQEFLRATVLANGELVLEFREFTSAQAGEQKFFTVTIRVHDLNGELDLIGSALVRDDPWRAAACATLDAVNRKLATLGVG
jgi:hypothetical protein